MSNLPTNFIRTNVSYEKELLVIKTEIEYLSLEIKKLNQVVELYGEMIDKLTTWQVEEFQGLRNDILKLSDLANRIANKIEKNLINPNISINVEGDNKNVSVAERNSKIIKGSDDDD